MLIKSATRNESRFTCDLCGATLKRKDHLERHKIIHTSERNHKCDECDRTFKREAQLRSHKNFHTRERQFKCEEKVCGKECGKKCGKECGKECAQKCGKGESFLISGLFFQIRSAFTLWITHNRLTQLWYLSLFFSSSTWAYLVSLRRDHYNKHIRSHIHRHMRSEMAQLSALRRSASEADLHDALSWAIC